MKLETHWSSDKPIESKPVEVPRSHEIVDQGVNTPEEKKCQETPVNASESVLAKPSLYDL